MKLDGLKSRADLNGQFGWVQRYDETSGRWGIRLSNDGTSKVFKREFLVPIGTLGGSTEGARLPKKTCRFEQRCWRPDCMFRHPDEQARIQYFAEVWNSKSLTCSPCDMVIEGTLDYHDVLARLEVMKEKFDNTSVSFNRTTLWDDADERLAQLDIEMKELTLLSAQKHVELKEEHVELKVEHVELRQVQEETNIKIEQLEEKVRNPELTRMFREMCQALTKQMNKMEEKVAELASTTNKLHGDG